MMDRTCPTGSGAVGKWGKKGLFRELEKREKNGDALEWGKAHNRPQQNRRISLKNG
jgi:hypothetical protein